MADVHLESKMDNGLAEWQAGERRAEIAATFERALEYARREGVRAVIIAGDLFDMRRVSKKALNFVSGLVAKFSEITFFCIGGNHDAGFAAGVAMPGNFRTFDCEWSYVSLDGVCFAGITPGKDIRADFADKLLLDERNFNIVIMHGKIATSGWPDNSVNLRALEGKGIDYLALGDSHSYKEYELGENGFAVYPGCLEGRGYDEPGEKGFVMLDTEAHTRTFIPFAYRTVYEVPADITGATDYNALTAVLDRASAGLDKKDIVKFLLIGTKTPETKIDLTALNKYVESRFFAGKVKDFSTLEINPREYENDISLKGEFVRLVLSSDLQEEEKNDAVFVGIKALRGEELEI